MDIKTIASKGLKLQQKRQTAIHLFNNFPYERLLGDQQTGGCGFAEFRAFAPSVHYRWKNCGQMLNLQS